LFVGRFIGFLKAMMHQRANPEVNILLSYKLAVFVEINVCMRPVPGVGPGDFAWVAGDPDTDTDSEEEGGGANSTAAPFPAPSNPVTNAVCRWSRWRSVELQ
jgi:hypothetical protein